MAKIYEGNKPFIFISYSHKDTPYVMDVVEALDAQGIRVWYDGGIEAGSEWPEYIANHLTACGCVLCFVSKNYADSDNCRRELTFSLNLKKPTLSLYMEQFEMSPGLQMQLGLVQAVFCDRFATPDRLVQEIASVPMVAACHDDGDDDEEYVQPAAPTSASAQVSANPSVAAYLKRVFMFLEDGDWSAADEYCEKVLDIDPECAEAYLGKLMAELKVTERVHLKGCAKIFDDNNHYKKILRFGDVSLKAEISGYVESVRTRLEEERVAREKREEEDRAERQKREEEERVAREKREEETKRKLLTMREKNDLVANRIAVGAYHTVALKTDGTVLATKCIGPANTDFGQCNVGHWRNVVAVAAAEHHTVGLTADGKVFATGDNSYGQCDTDSWSEIIAVSAGDTHTVGLRADGSVVATVYRGDSKKNTGQCDVGGWSNIVAIFAKRHHTIGLKSDGTVVATGYREKAIKDWKNTVALSGSGTHTVGLKDNGTVLATGSNEHGQCEVAAWEDIVSVSAAYNFTLGLKSDGTVVVTKFLGNEETYFGGRDVQGWKDMVAVTARTYHTVGVRADGTVVAIGAKNCGQCNVSGWKLFNHIDTLQQELEEARIVRELRQKEKQEYAHRRLLGMCQYCGGEFKGFFTKKCVECGRQKDY